jgi:amino acid permease
MAYLVDLVVYHFIKGDTMADRGPIRVIHWAGPVPTLSSFPVIVFAFTCHQNVGSQTNVFFSAYQLIKSPDVFNP